MSDTEPLRVVLLIGSESDALPTALPPSDSSPLARVRSEYPTIEVRIVSSGPTGLTVRASDVRLDPFELSAVDRLLRAIGAFALRDRLATFPVGRLLNSIGPVAPSRVYWRTVRRNTEAMRLLRGSDVVIAADAETVTAAWIAVHRGWAARAFLDRSATATS